MQDRSILPLLKGKCKIFWGKPITQAARFTETVRVTKHLAPSRNFFPWDRPNPKSCQCANYGWDHAIYFVLLGCHRLEWTSSDICTSTDACKSNTYRCLEQTRVQHTNTLNWSWNSKINLLLLLAFEMKAVSGVTQCDKVLTIIGSRRCEGIRKYRLLLFGSLRKLQVV